MTYSATKVGTISLPNTGAYVNYRNVSGQVNIPTGTFDLYIRFNDSANIKSFRIYSETVSCSEPIFSDINGNPVADNAITSGGNIKANVVIISDFSTTLDFIPLSAVLRRDQFNNDVVVDVKETASQVLAGETKTITLNIDLTNAIANDNLKIFIWDNFDNIKPHSSDVKSVILN